MASQRVLKPALLRWQLRQLLAVNAAALVIVILYVLLNTRPMVAPHGLELAAIVTHSGLVVWRLGQLASRRDGFLYTLGFSRDQICAATLAASAASAVLVCGTAWLIMTTGLRSLLQDRWYENRYFPFISPEEVFVPWVWLFGYALIMPLLHYAWIRAGQPCRGPTSGWMVFMLGMYFLAWSFDRAQMYPTQSTLLFCLAMLHAPAALLLLVACWQLHRTVEIRA